MLLDAHNVVRVVSKVNKVLLMRICCSHVNCVHANCYLTGIGRTRVLGFTNTFMFGLFSKCVAVVPCIGVEVFTPCVSM